ncbi:MAG: YdeI/OmpD-associated family protein, partial [Bacteroidales bacterium]|nr:YdeI/OmpD-associated family protein [Bacteroidales bacterium]
KALQKDKTAWQNFNSFPPLYQRIRVQGIDFYRKRSAEVFNRRLEKLVLMSREGKMYGEWNDKGRLLDY